MKELVELLKKKGLIFKELNRLDNKELGIKKRIEIFRGIDDKNRYILIFKIDRKSRFLLKDAVMLDEIKKMAEEFFDHGFRRYIVVISKNICSKAVNFLKERGFSVYFM